MRVDPQQVEGPCGVTGTRQLRCGIGTVCGSELELARPDRVISRPN
jgi:hypothetical protein